MVKRSVFCEDDIGDNGFCDTAVTGDGGCGVTGDILLSDLAGDSSLTCGNGEVADALCDKK